MPPRSFPPGPRSWLLGVDLMRRLTADPLAFYEDARRRYGDVVYMRLGPYRDYTLFHPDAIHELLTTKAKSFVRMRHQMNVFRQWNGDSVLIVEGNDWIRQRRVLQPAFQTKRFDGYSQAIVDVTLKSLERVVPKEGGVVDFERMAIDLTTAAICRTMFDLDLTERLPAIRDAVEALVQAAYSEMLSFSWPNWVPFPSVRRKLRAIQEMDDLVRGLIRERRASGVDRGDLLSMMLLATDDEADGKGLTDEEVRDNCVTIFLAGHDTTAAGLAWLGWFLASRPVYAERARAETLAATGDRLPTFADAARLKFLDQMISETLRHRPPAIAVFGREAIEEVELGGWTIPKGALVHAMSYTVQHDERWWPDPERFDPDRFSPERAGELNPKAYFPFGIGPRTCIGAHFARMEMAMAAAVLLQRYDLTPAEGQVEPKPASDVTLRPVGGIRLKLTPRR